MKVLILPSVFPDTIANMYDEAYINKQLGKDVYMVNCDHSIGVCWHNPSSNKARCYFCERYRKKMVKKIPCGINVSTVSSFIDDKILDEVEKLNFTYNTIQDIKELVFMDVNIGYCCLSIYISSTRNNNPKIDQAFKTYFDHLLKQTALYTIAINSALDTIKPDYLYVFNGRCTNSRPGIELAKQKGIHFICSEVKTVFQGKKIRRYFYDSMPHSIRKNEEMILRSWENSSLEDKEKEYLGKRFFESKIKKVFGGDTNYIANQKDNKMPADWDDSKHNIVIFNSSEDEFTSIGDEYDSKKLFQSQIEGIKYIAGVLEPHQCIRLYLKIHPNLTNIRYKYHTDLLKLESKYKNITVIPGNSDISTYGMMSRADKVMVFGSTSGVEAAYMKKPVILLSGAMYYDLGFCYVPHTQDEIEKLVLNTNLPSLYNANVLKIGYYWMDYFLPTPTYLSIDKTFGNLKWRGKTYKISLYPYKRLFGSKLLFRICEKMVETINTKQFDNKYLIPYSEE